MTISKAILAALAMTLFAQAYSGDGFAEKFQSLPEAVKATAKANMGKAFPVSISSAQSEDGWNYQINTRVDGKHHNLVIDDKGKLVAVKDETELAAIPAAAQSAIQSQNAAKLMSVEKITEGGQVSYGAVMKDEAQGNIVQLRVAADGTVKSKK